MLSCLNAGIGLLANKPGVPVLDIGCAVGRSTFDLAAKCNGIVLGIDINYSLLRIAQQVLRNGRVRFPLKRTGIVYDRIEFEVTFTEASVVDFWACDATALPFVNDTFQFISALNVLDNVMSPINLLKSVSNVFGENGKVVLASPYDWSGPIPVNNWLGGYAQRNEDNGASEVTVRNILSVDNQLKSGIRLTMIGEIAHHPWNVRVHNRRTACYDTHIMACEKQSPVE